MSGVITLTDDIFEKTVAEGTALVDFWAPWCMPCRMQGPIIEKVAVRVGDSAKICKMNVDEQQLAAQKYRITSIPTLLLFKNGQVVRQFVGVQDENTLVSAISG